MNPHLVSELSQILAQLTVFILAVFVGIEVISRVPTTLHTPLMSATNAIHGIVIVGALVVVGVSVDKGHLPLGPVVSIILVTLATINVVGGFVVTERMLQMFKPRAPRPPAATSSATKESTGGAK